ncbi:MAG: DUF5060 domain-containing protein [Opitutus sp.]
MRTLLCFAAAAVMSASCSLAAVSLVLIDKAEVWQRAEWRLEGVPSASNNFDPDLIRIDATFTAPSGRTLRVPAFWYQDFKRELVGGAQVLTPKGAPGWRLRFTPDEPGEYALAVSVAQPAQTTLPSTTTRFTVGRGSAPLAHGWIRTGEDHRTFATSDGKPLRLIGANVCWGGSARGSFDYDRWFPAMREAGENFARLWFAPWSMGIEHKPGTLNRYDLAEAWQADYVLQLAEQSGINVLIAMDHHGMFMSNDPAWGGSNNFWTRSSPYAVENGGPCANPNEFFTRADAQKLYQKRLRYLIGRYGYSPRLLSWQFFNEIDNSYQPRAALVSDDVVAWHRTMGEWLRANDPYQHLISTSLTGASDRPELWTLPELDFTVYHSYGEADPALHVAKIADQMAQRYRKPVMIGEIGTSHLNWNIANDPYLRGFRQGLWGGVLGGSVGSAMSWWWEGIHDDQVYPFYTVLRDVMARAGWSEGEWKPAAFQPDLPMPTALGDAVAEGEPLTASVPLNQLRLNPVPGDALLVDSLAIARAAERISSYLHGTNNPLLQQHAEFGAWFADHARLVFRVNSVAADADLLVRVDGEEKLRVPLVNKDGLAVLNDEINQEFTVELPAGKHQVEIAHTGRDWVNLKAVRFERIRPAAFVGGWEFKAQAVGLQSERAAVVYVRSPHVAWPAGALRYNPPVVHGATVTLTSWSAGQSHVLWLDPKTGRELAAATLVGEAASLTLPVPDFAEDIVGILKK